VANGGKISDGRTINVVAPAGGVVRGNPYRIDGWNGVAEVDAAAGTTFALNIDPTYEFYLPIAPVDNPARGALVYITAANTLAAAASGNTLFGKVMETKDAANNRLSVRLLNIA
jgi:predicted RecA/RadA family phage recombinase